MAALLETTLLVKLIYWENPCTAVCVISLSAPFKIIQIILNFGQDKLVTSSKNLLVKEHFAFNCWWNN